MKHLVLLCVLLFASQAQFIQKGELCQKLKAEGMDGFLGITLPNCEFAPILSSINHNRDGSSDYGIYQISSHYWCQENKSRKAKNDCKISCSNLLNHNIMDDLRCVKKIAAEAKGLTPWVAWQSHCQSLDLKQFNC
uniref:lysozyme n=1 Tax=Ornithorhynchus anatinus TaxID=9258 RepID=A0A6I8N971_ORNAN